MTFPPKPKPKSTTDTADTNRLTYKPLVKLIAKQTKYAEYEVEDILHGTALVLQQQLNQGKHVNIKGMGLFKLKHSKPRAFYNPLDKQKIIVEPKISVMLKPDLYMRNAINREVEPEVETELGTEEQS